MGDAGDDIEAKKLLAGRVPNPWFLSKGDSFNLEYYKKFLSFDSSMMTGNFQSFTINVEPLPFELGEEEAQMEGLATQKEQDEYKEALLRVDGMIVVLAKFLSPTHLAVALSNRTIVVNIEVKNGKIQKIQKKRTL